MMKCVIIDDEKLSLELLESNISRVPFLEISGKFRNPYDALSFLQSNPVELLFVDIQMPGMTGLELLAAVKNKMQVVIVSAYQQYAIDAYNLDVTDYLVKPVAFDRFLRACIKCQERLNYVQNENRNIAERDYFFVYVEYSKVKINYDDILYIEAMRDYIRIHLKNEKQVITRASLKSVEEKLNSERFQRVHKSFIVNLSKIISIKKGIVSIGNHEIPLSDNYKEGVNKILGLQA